MKYQQALIAWTPGTDLIRVGPLLENIHNHDWTEYPISYDCTGGAAYIGLRNCEDKLQRDMMLFIEFHSIVVRDQIPVEAAHREFLKIDEYRERIAPDIQGSSQPVGSLGGWWK